MSAAALTNLWGANEIYAGMDSISKLSNAKSRSISPENFTGEVGGGAKADPSEKIRNVSNAADKASNYGKGWFHCGTSQRNLYNSRHKGMRGNPANVDDSGG